MGSFKVGSITKDSPEGLWEKFKEQSGITREAFFDYFRGEDVGYAIEISEPDFPKPYDPQLLIPNFIPLQSFCYLSD